MTNEKTLPNFTNAEACGLIREMLDNFNRVKAEGLAAGLSAEAAADRAGRTMNRSLGISG